MSYDPITDFVALSRLSGGSAFIERMPGLDYVLAALARAGLIKISVGQAPPTVNQATTVWFKTSEPSWVAEGSVFLWNAATSAYELATPALWASLLNPSGYSFQSASKPLNIINAGVTLFAVQRAAPTATTLVLPSLSSQFLTGRQLRIVDWSTGVTNHAITLTAPDGASIMKASSLVLLSTPDQLAGAELRAVPELNGWVVSS